MTKNYDRVLGYQSFLQRAPHTHPRDRACKTVNLKGKSEPKPGSVGTIRIYIESTVCI